MTVTTIAEFLQASSLTQAQKEAVLERIGRHLKPNRCVYLGHGVDGDDVWVDYIPAGPRTRMNFSLNHKHAEHVIDDTDI